MARRTPRPEATHKKILIPLKKSCEQCGQPLSVANHGHRSVASERWPMEIDARHPPMHPVGLP
ncbi:hypothetical protein KSC_020140 [Ktedonobacter sp. SOSP1-52]|uniref:hypothetical protein n=1 Tax=Ktedonobacter sp. SOSP1-52 TaxID=2778366 RepID=UPI00191564E8|nr:hypothetical protein [Ktedonobacter sp. SOSP1-52]GHO63122.1 hypothetical protein KSC_020140 [Ktedonobacter sp. SOSP1-52]